MLHQVSPCGVTPIQLAHHFLPLRDWALSRHAEADLEAVFGPSLNWIAAYSWLARFRRGDFSELPPVQVLPAADMPGLWGGYSRDTREIFLSADCPPDLAASVLLEEVGHFLDQEISAEETPGDEGALFSALVLGQQPAPQDCAAWAGEETLSPVFHAGRELLVEAAPKLRGNVTANSKLSPSAGKNRISPNATPDTILSQDGNVVYTNNQSVRLTQTKAGQRVIGSRGNDTFVVSSQDVRLEDPNGGVDTVEAKVSFDLKNFGFIENLTAAPGTAPVTLGGNSKANVITGNDGANKLDGGMDNVRDTLAGGKGNDTYVIRDTLDLVVEAANGGNDTIETTINNFTLNFANVENVTFVGTGSATLTGNASANILTGGTMGDTLFGGSGTTPADTLRGGQGDDVYIVSRQSDRIVENNGPLDGTDTIRTSAATYSMAALANVENLVYTGGLASRLTGNSGDNTITGGNTVRNTIDGGAGNDYLIGGSTTDSLIGGLGSDTLVVNRWADSPVGALGTSLQPGGGTDVLDGGAGADWYVVNSQSAYTFKETGTDRDTIASTVSYSLKYNKNISDNIENLYLIGKGNLTGTGSDLANEITGNDGDNVLFAGAGNDTVYGGLGADLIHGEAGDDILHGGGQPQTDLPANVSTAITINPGQSYTGKIDFRRDTDWIRAKLIEGVSYTFELKFTPEGTAALQQFSDAAFGEAGRDITPATISTIWWNFFTNNRNKPFLPFVGDAKADLDSLLYDVGTGVNEANHRNDHTVLVFNGNGQRAGGVVIYDPTNSIDTNINDNIIRFEFIPFADGEYYIPISGAGPLGGRYTVTLSDSQTVGLPFVPIIADDAPNTLIGGLGNDLLIAGNGRDSLVASSEVSGEEAPLSEDGQAVLPDPSKGFFGDYLFGGTNGVPGAIDLDNAGSITAIAARENFPVVASGDTLVSSANVDLFARVGDTLLGANGNDTVLARADEVIETPDGTFALSVGETIILGNTRFIGFDAGIANSNPKTNFKLNLGDSLISGSLREITAASEGITQTKIDQIKNATSVFQKLEFARTGDTLVANANNAFSALAGDTLISALAGGAMAYTVFVAPGETFSYPGGELSLDAGDPPVTHFGITYTATTRRLLVGESLVGGSSRQVVNGFTNRITVHKIFGDTLIGGNGKDTLDGGNGKDSMAGGIGDDIYFVNDLGSFIANTSIRNAGDRIFEKDDGGLNDRVVINVANSFRNFSNDLANGLFDFANPALGLDSVTGWGFDVDLKNAFRNIEHASLMGSANLYVLGNGDPNSLYGNFGNNLLVGGEGNDSLLGEGGNDYLIGGDGGDLLDGGSGQNTMDGGFGDDTYIVNDRNDRIINEIEGQDGGKDLVRTFFNFDPIQGDGVNQYDPLVPDNSPSVTKSQSFASLDLPSFYNLDHFELLGQAAYGVGNALNNSMTASDGANAMLLGMGGEDTLFGGTANDSLFGDTPRFYALPDLYAPAPTDTRTQEFLDKVVGQWGSDYLDGKDGNDYLDGGRGFDTMIGGRGNDTYLQDHVDDYIVATVEDGDNGRDELITSVNIAQAPDGITEMMLVVKDQDRDANDQSITGQEQVASFASFLGSEGGITGIIYRYDIGAVSVSVGNANRLELMYSYNDGDAYRSNRTDATHRPLNVGTQEVDFNDNTKVAYNLSWSAGRFDSLNVVGYTVRYRQTAVEVNDLVLASKLSGASDAGGLVIDFVNPRANGQSLAISTEETRITVRLETDASGNVVTTYSALAAALSADAAASALVQASLSGAGNAIVQESKEQYLDVWRTYLDGTSQDLRGSQAFPSLRVDNLARGSYEFEVVSNRLAMPVERDFTPGSPTFGQALREQVVTLQGGGGNDFISAEKLPRDLPGGIAADTFTNPLLLNKPLPYGLIFAPEPVDPSADRQRAFAAYLDGGAGNDLLVSARTNGGLGVNYQLQGITFSGLNTLVGGQGSDTFVVKNGGLARGDTFDHVIKYENETPVNYGGVGASLNGGQHNLVVSDVKFLTLSDTIVSQGKFIDQLVVSSSDAYIGQFAMGNRLDNFIFDAPKFEGFHTLVGGGGRDSIVVNSRWNILIGGTAYAMEDVGRTVRSLLVLSGAAASGSGSLDLQYIPEGLAVGGRIQGLGIAPNTTIASIVGNTITLSQPTVLQINGDLPIFTDNFERHRDTDPIPFAPNGPGSADPSQFWFVPGYYGNVLDPARNQDTLVANEASTLDGGAGNDSLVGSATSNDRGDLFIVSQGQGGLQSQDIRFGDAVFGNGGNDTVMFTDSDYLWWSGHQRDALLNKNSYTIAGDISNLILQAGAPSARNAYGNRESTGNSGQGGNRMVGNEFDNILSGRGVGGSEQNGTGVDSLTGGAGSDQFLIDVFDPVYFNRSTYTNSSSNQWNPVIRLTLAATRHEWIRDQSNYRDFDYVVVTDFETNDRLVLNHDLSQYSIGNLPKDIGNPGGEVGPVGDAFTSRQFGIYFTGNTFDPGVEKGKLKPNLVAVIQSPFDLLGPLENLVARPSSPNLVQEWPSSISPVFMGWGQFYELASSPFAAYINQPYTQENSSASIPELARSGNDFLTAGPGATTLNGFGGNDTILGGARADFLLGGSGNDSLLGDTGNDTLLGESGSDYLDGGLGNDSMIGGSGNDTYIVDSLGDMVVESLGEGTDWVRASVSGYNLHANVENLVLIGSAIEGTGNLLDNSLVGNNLNNTLSGVAGNNTFNGGGGVDTLIGGLGNDVFIVDSITDRIIDSGGSDTVLTSVSFNLSNPNAAGGTGIENLRLTSSINSTLSGNSADNLIFGNTKSDSLFGGAGKDTLIGTSVYGDGEIDTLTGGLGADLFVLGDKNGAFYEIQPSAGDYALLTDFSVTDGDKLQLHAFREDRIGVSYIVSSANIFNIGVPAGVNTFLYRDGGGGVAALGDNLIAAIAATGGTGTGGALSQADLANVASFV